VFDSKNASIEISTYDPEASLAVFDSQNGTV
jgi:hypothetical protein